jgi:tetratricopeptide (TPR) repeat protein
MNPIRSIRPLVHILPIAIIAACTPRQEPRAPLVDGLGEFHRPVSTKSPEAQRAFDRGLLLTYAFNHQEAVRSFEEAARRDPGLAMACWGKALALGPNINIPMDEQAGKMAFEASRKAQELGGLRDDVEGDLIRALARRYADPPPSDRAALDGAYADAMREVHRKHPDDPDAAALFAEALLDLRPWDQWTPEGKPQPGTEEVVAVLEDLLRRHPRHPLGNHLYIHAVEASPNPGHALPSAERLGDIAPGAGHLVHMPAHISIRVGRYADAVESNRRALEADRNYFEGGGIHGGYYEIYRAHNYHFLAYAAMFEGRSMEAMEAARGLVRDLPPDLVKAQVLLVEGFLSLPYHAFVRFGRWDDILKEPEPAPHLLVTRAARHYARAVALSVTDRIGEAEAELAELERAVAAIPEDALIGNNKASRILAVAVPMAKGELLFRKGDLEGSFASLREARKLDETLHYDEPWGWMQPVAHALGALLLQAGRVEEAEKVYRDDLERHPENGWSLHGLAECLRRRGIAGEAAKVDERFRTAWARADIQLPGSCFCRTDTAAAASAPQGASPTFTDRRAAD